MRSLGTVVGVLVAAAVGLHCSAPVDAPTAAPDTVEPAQPATENASSRPAPTASPSTSTEPSMPGFDALIRDGATPLVTSTVTDRTGATYVAGTFVGNVTFGTTPIKSRGNQDVFLMKLDSRGNVEWVRAVGSAWDESAPRVTVEGSSVTVVGITKGEMDCGSGPLQRWSSDTFFLCIFGGADGAALSGGVFPTGNP